VLQEVQKLNLFGWIAKKGPIPASSTTPLFFPECSRGVPVIKTVSALCFLFAANVIKILVHFILPIRK